MDPHNALRRARKQFILSAGVGLLLTLGARASTVNVAYDAGIVNQTTALADFVTDGATMSGMGVTAKFSDGSSQTRTWAATGAFSGGVTGTGWSLNESGDTFSSDWTLSNNRTSLLIGLLIDAGPGNTVFDTDGIADVFGTDGSFRGLSFALSGISAADNSDTITVTYRNAVALTGAAPVGDLFRNLDVSLSDGLSRYSKLKFQTDTESLKSAGDIKPVPETTSTLAALAMAFGGLVLARRRLA